MGDEKWIMYDNKMFEKNCGRGGEEPNDRKVRIDIKESDAVSWDWKGIVLELPPVKTIDSDLLSTTNAIEAIQEKRQN